MGFSVVVFETNPRVAQTLAGKLSSHFHAVHLTHSGDELRKRVASNRPEAVVLDMEASRLTDVRSLHEDFPCCLSCARIAYPMNNFGLTHWRLGRATFASPMMRRMF